MKICKLIAILCLNWNLSISEQNEIRKLKHVAIIMFVDCKLFSLSEISYPGLIGLEAAFNPTVPSGFWLVLTWRDSVSRYK